MPGPYRQLLGRPYVARLVACALVGRIPVGMLGLALVLLARDRLGSYAIAGATSAAFAGGAVGAPVLGRLVDLLGQTRVLAVTAVADAALLVACVALAVGGAPTWAVIACAGAAGFAVPPLSSAMRALWAPLAGERLLDTAFALEAVVVELWFILGPLLAAALASAVSPAFAVLVAAVLLLAGTLAFAAQAPSREWRPERSGARSNAGPLAAIGMRTLVVVTFPAGTAFGALEVGLPAFAERFGSPAAGGVLVAAIAVGSLAGGLWYGSRSWERPLERRFVELSALLAVSMVPLALADSLGLMLVLCVLSGLTLAPLTAVTYGLVSRLAPTGTETEAFTWIITAQVGGTAVGAAVAGVLVDELDVGAALVLPAAALTAATAVALLRRRSLVPQPARP